MDRDELVYRISANLLAKVPPDPGEDPDWLAGQLIRPVLDDEASAIPLQVHLPALRFHADARISAHRLRARVKHRSVGSTSRHGVNSARRP